MRMDAKLTLKLDERSIACARQFAESRGSSISRIVEQYFDTLCVDDQSEAAHALPDLRGTIVGRLLGIAHAEPEPDVDAARYDALRERYLREDL